MSAEMLKLRDVLKDIERSSPKAWVYLPDHKQWHLDSMSAVLESEEVPPELEDDPNAGIPEFARHNHLMQVLPVTVVQDILRNTRAQKTNASIDEYFQAFEYYYRHDAFIQFN